MKKYITSKGCMLSMIIVIASCLLIPTQLAYQPNDYQAQTTTSVTYEQGNSVPFQQKPISITNEYPACTITLEQDKDKLVVAYKISDFTYNTVVIDGNKYCTISLDQEPQINEEGNPDVATIPRSIIIPDDQKMDIKIIKASYHDYPDFFIAPSKGLLTMDTDPEKIPYRFSDIYKKDAYYPESLAELGHPYILRDFRGLVLTVNPLRYNPVTHVLRFYQEITLEIHAVGKDTENVLKREKPLTSLVNDFATIYDRHFINRDTLDYIPVNDQGSMLVITYDAFYDEMIPFVQWKNLKGIPTEMVRLSTIGDGSAEAIRMFIQQYYMNHELSYVLLVGDVEQIPTLRAQDEISASDPTYSFIIGEDHYPDILIGRFSAQTNTDVQTQVRRSITYERDPEIGAEWYHKGTGIGGPRFPQTYLDETTAPHLNHIRDDLLGYTYTSVDQLYDRPIPGEIELYLVPSEDIANAVNDGRSIINYCTHGTQTKWVTGDFDVADVNNLLNVNMLPFIWSMSCLNGAFDQEFTCFAEAWLRATHNGEPVGAIAVFMSSHEQHWPYAAQTEMVDVLVGTYQNNRQTTFGGLSICGCMFWMDLNGEGGDGEGCETDYWHIFGDPSLQVRTDTPSPLFVDHPQTIDVDSTLITVQVSDQTNTPVQNAYCAVSCNGNSLGTGYTDTQGFITIIMNQPLHYGVPVDIVVTAYNTIPYLSTIEVIDMIPPVTTCIIDGNAMSLQSTDNDIVADIWYCVVGEDIWWWVYSEPVSFPVGQYQVRYYAVDTAGNIEAVQSISFPVDVQLITPNGGEEWGPGDHLIEWMSSAFGDTADIFFSHDSGQHWTLLAENIPNQAGVNRYIWSIPCDAFPYWAHCRIKVVPIDVIPLYRYDNSDTDFVAYTGLPPPDGPWEDEDVDE